MGQMESRETINFKAHDALIKQMIYKQHGEHFKSIVELIQNAEDSGSTSIILDFTDEGFSVKDNGSGFPDKKYIVDYFATFGTPHEDGDSRFGRFRIGRGQIMSMANVSWRSKMWEMHVNINSDDEVPAFDLITHKESVDGCLVSGTWFEKLDRFEFIAQQQKLLRAIKYLSILVFCPDGQRLNTSPEEIDWRLESDHFYYNPDDTNQLNIYNLGVFVTSMSNYEAGGIFGDLVSKQHLGLNTARNSILHGCNVWQKIKSELRAFKNKENSTKKLTANEREGLFAIWQSGGNLDLDIVKIPLIKDIKGKFVTLKTYLNKDVCVVDKSSTDTFLIDKVYQAHNKHVLFLDKDYVKRFGLEGTAKDFMDRIATTATIYFGEFFYQEPDWEMRRKARVLTELSYSCKTSRDIEFSSLSERYEGAHSLIDKAELSPTLCLVYEAFAKAMNLLKFKEKLVRAVSSVQVQEINAIAFKHYLGNLRGWSQGSLEARVVSALALGEKGRGYYSDLFAHAIFRDEKEKVNCLFRNLMVGESSTAEAWTDGASYIALNKTLLAKYKRGYEGFSYIATVIAHELSHTDGNLQTHVHDIEFYESFHNLMMGNFSGENPIMFLTRTAYLNWVNAMELKGLDVPSLHYNNLQCSNRKSRIKTELLIKLDGNAGIQLKRNNHKAWIVSLGSVKSIKALREKFPEITIDAVMNIRKEMQEISNKAFLRFDKDLAKSSWIARSLSMSSPRTTNFIFDLGYNEKTICSYCLPQEILPTLNELNKYLEESVLGEMIKLIKDEIYKNVGEKFEVKFETLNFGKLESSGWQ